MSMALPPDILYEIAHNIKDFKTFATFTACSRKTREYLYNRELTRHFCIIIANYIWPSVVMGIFAKKIGAYIVANRKCLKSYKIQCYPYRILSIRNKNIKNIICANCLVLYKFTRNAYFSDICKIYETTDIDNMPIRCDNCPKIVCRKDGYYDYCGKSPLCLSECRRIKICEKCGMYPLTERYSKDGYNNGHRH